MSRRVVRVANSTLQFISSALGFISKYDEGWEKIYYLSHLVECSINDNIPNNAGEMRYIWFQDVLRIVMQADKSCIIPKHDVKNVFRNFPVVSHSQWLLKFIWKER